MSFDIEQPCGGDLLVATAAGADHRYTITQVPGTPQASWNSCDGAVAIAREFARRHAVNVWITDGQSIVMLSCYRRQSEASDD